MAALIKGNIHMKPYFKVLGRAIGGLELRLAEIG